MAIEQEALTMSAPIFLQHTKEDAAILARNPGRAVAYAKADRIDARTMRIGVKYYRHERLYDSRDGLIELRKVQSGSLVHEALE